MSTLLGALSSGGVASVSAAELAVAEAERDGGWPRGVLPAVCYFNLLDVAHQAGDKAGADRISSLIRQFPKIRQRFRLHALTTPHQVESDNNVALDAVSAGW